MLWCWNQKVLERVVDNRLEYFLIQLKHLKVTNGARSVSLSTSCIHRLDFLHIRLRNFEKRWEMLRKFSALSTVRNRSQMVFFCYYILMMSTDDIHNTLVNKKLVNKIDRYIDRILMYCQLNIIILIRIY